MFLPHSLNFVETLPRVAIDTNGYAREAASQQIHTRWFDLMLQAVEIEVFYHTYDLANSLPSYSKDLPIMSEGLE